MTFNSVQFAIFLPVVFFLYWFLTSKNLRFQNLLLLVSSYFFYACWDWRFLFLLFSVSFVNYSIGLLILSAGTKGRKKSWLVAGIVMNIMTLSFFKYFNFFTDGLIQFFSHLGVMLQKPTLQIILPLGISFYIFLSLSYIIDIYRNKLRANNNLFDVLLTLSFFPIIFAGPIQRPVLLLPQIQRKRTFNQDVAVSGMKQILWGLFMKVVIADNCAIYVNDIFQNFKGETGSTLLLGGILYSIQIYADFAGYTEIAIGVSKLFGFDLMRNFKYPYFARDITEFWKRWHISLTSWFRDYIFLPVAYFVSGKIPSEKVLFIKTDLIIYFTGISITWLLTGLWHGANYTFMVWGFIHGFFLIAYHVLKKPRHRFLSSVKVKNSNLILVGFERTVTLLLIIFSWIVFRSSSIDQAGQYISGIVSASLLTTPHINHQTDFLIMSFFIASFFIFEWINRNQSFPMVTFGKNWKRPARWAVYFFMTFVIIYYSKSQQQFIYFQF